MTGFEQAVRGGAPIDAYRSIRLHLAAHPRCACGGVSAVVQRSGASLRAVCRRCAGASAPMGRRADDDRGRRLRLARATR